MTATSTLPSVRCRRGITLTEILIAILILSVGLASLATLFPLGLLRLREATRSTRSAYLMESAAADIVSRGLLTSSSFSVADQYNYYYSSLGLTPWFSTVDAQVYNPLIQDTPAYQQDWFTTNKDGTITVTGANAGFPGGYTGPPSGYPGTNGGYGMPFAYDPLWRFQTISALFGTSGYYPGDTFEARFGAGLGFIQNDPNFATDSSPPSAHGLQRITNFNRPYYVSGGANVPIMPISATVPGIFVSPEDVVWVENAPLKTFDSVLSQSQYSPILADINISTDALGDQTTVNDWHYSWMFTGLQNNVGTSSTFDGNIVVFENRPFGIIDATNTAPNAPAAPYQTYQVEGETVVEAIWGYAANTSSYSGAAPGFGISADRTVLLRWYASQPDPVVHVGDWIADVTYERNAPIVGSRFLSYPQYASPGGAKTGASGGLQNVYNNGEWDNLPAQRCFWYRVQKAGAPAADSTSTSFRSMVVTVDRTLQARTPISSAGVAGTVNAALICPSVVNVIPQTIFTR